MNMKIINIMLFLISILYIITGLIFIFFPVPGLIEPLSRSFSSIFKSVKAIDFFIAVSGSFIASWGVMIFISSVYAITEFEKIHRNTVFLIGLLTWLILSLYIALKFSLTGYFLFSLIIIVLFLIPLFFGYILRKRS